MGGVCAMLGLLVIIGWLWHLPALIQIRPSLAPMHFNTALCFILAGVALGVSALDSARLAGPALGGLVVALGGLTLIEYLCHVSLGIDQLLFHGDIATVVPDPGRMSPVSSLCFALAGLALLLLGMRRARRARAVLVGSLASVVISISLVAMLGYVFGLPGTYGWGQLTRIALHTAGGFGLLGVALFIIAWHLARQPGERTPRWLPVPLALGVFTGSLVLYFALESKQNQEIAQTLKADAESVQNQITLRMEARIRAFARMTRRWELAGEPAQAAWEADAADFLHDLPDLHALAWIDAAQQVRWIVPQASNETRLDIELTQELRTPAVEKAQREDQPVITNVKAFRGGLGFVVYVPIAGAGKSHGLLAATFHAQSCLDRYLPDAVAAGEAIRISENGRIFYERDAASVPSRSDAFVWQKIKLNGATWDLRMWPTPALAARLNSLLPEVVLCLGALGSLLLAAACFYAQSSSRRAAEATRANTALQAALDQVKTLEGLLPICSLCKRVRDDSGYWNQIDTYLRRHTKASISHGYCPECAAKAFAEFGLAVPEQLQEQLAARNFE